MSDDRLIEFLASAGTDLTARFAQASTLGEGSSQEVADFREGALRELIQRYFPLPQRVTKGKILGAAGHLSASIDCVILNAAHPNLIDAEGKYSFLLADGVDVAIELKPTLLDQREVERAVRQGRTVKSSRRFKHGLLRPGQLRAQAPEAWPDYAEDAKTVPYVIFTNKTWGPERLVHAFREANEAEGLGRFEEFDLIVVNGVGLLFNQKTKLHLPRTSIGDRVCPDFG